MNVAIRSYVSSGIAVASVGAFVVAVPTAQEDVPLHPRLSAVALAAQVQPLETPTAVAPGVVQSALPAAIQIVGAPIEQARFHVAFVTDFLTTGAVLFAREFAIPGQLAADVGGGVAVPVAVNRALQAFVQVELDAGRELVRFGTQYVDFQLSFAANVLQDAVVIATAVPTAISELAASAVAGLMPAAKPASVSPSGSEQTSLRLPQVESSRPDSIRHGAKDATSSDSTVTTRHSTAGKADAVKNDAVKSDAVKNDDETGSDTSETNTPNSGPASGHGASSAGDSAARRGTVADSDHDRREHESTAKPHRDAERHAEGAADNDKS